MSTADATAAATAAPMSFREVLRIEVMRRVWYAQVISLFGDFLALFAVIVVVSFAMHGTPNQITGVSAFFGPAQQVTIRTTVPVHGLISANALMQMAFMGMRILGPATAGTIAATFGAGTCYAIDVLSFLASAALI